MVQARPLHGRRKAFLLGIEGVGMSAAAEILLAVATFPLLWRWERSHR